MENQVISTCSLEKELVMVDRESPLSLIQDSTYATVNTCTGQEVDRYEIREIAPFIGITAIIFLVVSIEIFLTWIIARNSYF